MATFHFELVSPERIAFAGEVDQVDIPGAEGDFGVYAGHAPLISLLRPGVVTVYKGNEETKLVVLGGLAEVGPKGLTLLADVATSFEEVDRAALQAHVGPSFTEEPDFPFPEAYEGKYLDRRRASGFRRAIATCIQPARGGRSRPCAVRAA